MTASSLIATDEGLLETTLKKKLNHVRNKRQGSNKVSHKADTQKCKEMFINHFETITINIIIAFFIIYSLITEHLKKKKFESWSISQAAWLIHS